MAGPSHDDRSPEAIAAEIAAREPLWDFHSEHARAASAEPDGAVRSRYFAEISAFARLRPDRAGRVSRGGAATARHIDANDQRG
jgi:hypothetical protein